jgi:hypothetical protein
MNKTFLATALIAAALYSNVFAAEESALPGSTNSSRPGSPRGAADSAFVTRVSPEAAAGVVYVQQGVYAADLASLREELGLQGGAIGGVRTDLEALCARVDALELSTAAGPSAITSSVAAVESEQGQGPVVAAVDSHARDIAALEKKVNELTTETAEHISRLNASVGQLIFERNAFFTFCTGAACTVAALHAVNTLRNAATGKRS